MGKVYDALVAAGTTEAKEAIECLQAMGMTVAATVATAYGAQVLKKLEAAGADVYVGRKNVCQFAAMIKDFQVKYIVDATHPFAVDVTKTIQEAVNLRALDGDQVHYIRYVRKRMDYAYNNIIYVRDAMAAAQILKEMSGNFLLTTGANTVHIYKKEIPDFNKRGYVRVLDTAQSLEKCARCGIADSHVIAKNPPFSKEDNMACIGELDIEVLVSKDSGQSGGMSEKIESAKALGILVILIERPMAENGVSSKDELKMKIRKEG